MQPNIRRDQPAGDLSPLALISDAWDLCRNNLGATVGVGALVGVMMYSIQFVVGMVAQLLLFALMTMSAVAAEVIGELAATVLMTVAYLVPYVGMLAAIIVVQTLAVALYQIGWMKVIRGQAAPVNFFAVARYSLIPLVVVSLVTSVAGSIGLLLFVVGSFIVYTGLAFAATLVWDHKVRGLEAVALSWALTDGYKLSLLWLALALGVLNMAGALACGVGLFATLPVSVGAFALFYQRIARPGNAYISW